MVVFVLPRVTLLVVMEDVFVLMAWEEDVGGDLGVDEREIVVVRTERADRASEVMLFVSLSFSDIVGLGLDGDVVVFESGDNGVSGTLFGSPIFEALIRGDGAVEIVGVLDLLYAPVCPKTFGVENGAYMFCRLNDS